MTAPETIRNTRSLLIRAHANEALVSAGCPGRSFIRKTDTTTEIQKATKTLQKSPLVMAPTTMASAHEGWRRGNLRFVPCEFSLHHGVAFPVSSADC